MRRPRRPVALDDARPQLQRNHCRLAAGAVQGAQHGNPTHCTGVGRRRAQHPVVALPRDGHRRAGPHQAAPAHAPAERARRPRTARATRPRKRSKSSSAGARSDSRRDSVPKSLRIWSRWSLFPVAPSVQVCDSGIGPLLRGSLWGRLPGPTQPTIPRRSAAHLAHLARLAITSHHDLPPPVALYTDPGHPYLPAPDSLAPSHVKRVLGLHQTPRIAQFETYTLTIRVAGVCVDQGAARHRLGLGTVGSLPR